MRADIVQAGNLIDSGSIGKMESLEAEVIEQRSRIDRRLVIALPSPPSQATESRVAGHGNAHPTTSNSGFSPISCVLRVRV